MKPRIKRTHSVFLPNFGYNELSDITSDCPAPIGSLYRGFSVPDCTQSTHLPPSWTCWWSCWRVARCSEPCADILCWPQLWVVFHLCWGQQSCTNTILSALLSEWAAHPFQVVWGSCYRCVGLMCVGLDCMGLSVCEQVYVMRKAVHQLKACQLQAGAEQSL